MAGAVFSWASEIVTASAESAPVFPDARFESVKRDVSVDELALLRLKPALLDLFGPCRVYVVLLFE